MIGNSHEYDIMAAVESQHWWYATLHSQVIQAIQKYSKDQLQLNHAIPILDAGCGTGGLLMAFQQAGYDHAQGFDISSDAVAHAKARGLDAKIGDLNHLSDFAPSQSFDVIVNNDTLYHLTVDQRKVFLKSCLNLLKPKGIMIVNVPALDAFNGNHDLAVGITERFVKATLVAFIKSSGFEVIEARYWPFILSPAIWATRVTQKKLRREIAPTHGYKSDLALPSPLANKILRKICAFEQGLSLMTPWGSSLFLILQKPAHL